jgi:TPR repeat protein
VTDSFIKIRINEEADTRDVDEHLRLAEIYEKGIDTESDHDKTLHHMVAAAELGSATAMVRLGSRYDGFGELGLFDPEKAMEWYRKAAEIGNDTASEAVADRIVNGRTAEECTEEEIKEIEHHYLNSHLTGDAYYKLGKFYSDGVSSTDYNGPEYEKARRWLTVGMSRHQKGGQKCGALLAEWGVGNDASENKNTQKWYAILQITSLPIVMLIWWVIGSALLVGVMTVMSVTLPIFIVGAIIYAIYQARN